jgi:glucokinase
MKKNIIAWDLGATKCAAGVVEYETESRALTCLKSTSIKLSDTTSLEDLIQNLEQQLDFSIAGADAICIGGAGFYDGQELLLEGVYPYRMLFQQVAAAQKWPVYAVIHDYAPIVCATFTNYLSDEKNIKRLNQGEIQPFGRRMAFGIGTGLGGKDGVLLPNGDFWLGQNEVGHIGISMPPSAELLHVKRHYELMQFSQQQCAIEERMACTFEKILSGPGAVRLYRFLYSDSEAITPEIVGEKMQKGLVPELMNVFSWYLGLFVGTMQLNFMPEGGLWITGGVALSNLNLFDAPEFFDGIHASPAYMPQREHYPLGVLCNPEHALIGGGYYAAVKLLCELQ